MKEPEADWNTWALRNWEHQQEMADAKWERSLTEFQRAPYDALEWEAHRADPYMLLSLALELMADELQCEHKATDQTRKDFRDWVDSVIAEMDT